MVNRGFCQVSQHIPLTWKHFYDKSSKFLDYRFQELLESYSIEGAITMIKKLQASSLIEILDGLLKGQLCSVKVRGEK